MSARSFRIERALVIAAVLCALIAHNRAAADDDAAKPPGETDTKTSHGPDKTIEELGPVLYLMNKDGKLVPVPGWTLDDFRRLLAERAVRRQSPRFSLHRLVADGSAHGGHVKLTVRLAIKLYDADPDDWVRVPLRMGRGILQSEAKYSGPGKLFLEYEDAKVGYVAWLRGKSDKLHQLTLSFLVPLEEVGDEARLHLSVPRAVPSQLKLRIPGRGVVAKVSEGATLLLPVTKPKETELTALGPAGDFYLSWRAERGQPSKLPPALETEGLQLVRIQIGQIETEAKLTVRSLNEAFDRCRVRLPPGARLTRSGGAGYSLVPLTGSEDKKAGLGAIVEVKLNEKTTGPVEIKLNCHRTYPVGDPKTPLELAGFEVIEAVRQSGRIGVELVGDWQVRWAALKSVRRVDTASISQPQRDLAAAFEYYSQPYSLMAQVLPPSTRVSVEAVHLVDVAQDSLSLESTLKYRVVGAKIDELILETGGWEIDAGGVGPKELVDATGTRVEGSTRLRVPLLQSKNGEFVIQLRGHSAIASGDSDVFFSLPTAQVDSLSQSTLLVVSEDNVQLAPRREDLVDLVPTTYRPAVNLPLRQQKPLYYRVAGARVQFGADRSIKSREITADLLTRVTLSRRIVDVDQTISYSIAYVPVEALTLRVPRDFAEKGKINVQIDGEDAKWITVAGDQEEGLAGVRVILPAPRIGNIELAVQSEIPFRAPRPNEKVRLVIPQVLPDEGSTRRHELHVTHDEDLRFELAGGDWTAAAGPPVTAAGATQRYTTSTVAQQIDLDVSATDRRRPGVVIRRGWVQTWLSDSDRHDWAVYQIRAHQGPLELELPAGTDPMQTAVWVDRRPAPPRESGGNLVVNLPPNGDGEYRLELRYALQNREFGSKFTATLPRFSEQTWVEQAVYWQLILPRDRHLLGTPQGWSPEFHWQWTGFGFVRVGLRNEIELANWSGARLEAVVPIGERSTYLFSSTAVVGEIEVRVFDRATLILIASGVMLAAVLLVAYVPPVRAFGVLFSAGVATVAFGFVFPEPGVLLAQSALLGLMLALPVALLRTVVTSLRERNVVVHGSTAGSSVRNTATEMFLRPEDAGSQPTTVSGFAPVAAPALPHNTTTSSPR